MILNNLSTIDAHYTIIQIGTSKKWEGDLPGGCEKVLVLSDTHTYQVVFNALGEEVSTSDTIIPCARIYFNLSNGRASVDFRTPSIQDKSQKADLIISRPCNIGNSSQMYHNTLYMDTWLTIQLSIPLLLIGGFKCGVNACAKKTTIKSTN